MTERIATGVVAGITGAEVAQLGGCARCVPANRALAEVRAVDILLRVANGGTGAVEVVGEALRAAPAVGAKVAQLGGCRNRCIPADPAIAEGHAAGELRCKANNGAGGVDRGGSSDRVPAA